MEINQDSILPKYQLCSQCDRIISTRTFFNQTYFFYCDECCIFTFWAHNTTLSKSQISFSQLEKLIILYLDNKSASDAFSILEYSFVQDPLSKNTVLRYFSIFNEIILDFYQQTIPTIFFDGTVEIDETYLFPKKNLCSSSTLCFGRYLVHRTEKERNLRIYNYTS